MEVRGSADGNHGPTLTGSSEPQTRLIRSLQRLVETLFMSRITINPTFLCFFIVKNKLQAVWSFSIKIPDSLYFLILRLFFNLPTNNS